MKYWLMRAGDYGEARDLFLTESIIAMDWRVGDLRLLPTKEKLFMQAYSECSRVAYPEDDKPRSSHHAGTNYSFIHRMERGDGVLFAPKKTKQVNDPNLYLGRIAGDYSFDPTAWKEFKHQRKVTWQVTKPRTEFSKELVHLLGHYPGTLCQIKAVHHPELAALLTS